MFRVTLENVDADALVNLLTMPGIELTKLEAMSQQISSVTTPIVDLPPPKRSKRGLSYKLVHKENTLRKGTAPHHYVEKLTSWHHGTIRPRRDWQKSLEVIMRDYGHNPSGVSSVMSFLIKHGYFVGAE